MELGSIGRSQLLLSQQDIPETPETPESQDPKRNRPEGVAVIQFLLQIGNENPLLETEEPVHSSSTSLIERAVSDVCETNGSDRVSEGNDRASEDEDGVRSEDEENDGGSASGEVSTRRLIIVTEPPEVLQRNCCERVVQYFRQCSGVITPDEDADRHPEIKEAWRLGDIVFSGEYKQQNPIWRLNDPQGGFFVTDHNLADNDMAAGYMPATFPHSNGEIHGGLFDVCWAILCVNNILFQEDFQALERGINLRYAAQTNNDSAENEDSPL